MTQHSAIYFADALSRERALTPDEVDKLDSLIRRQCSGSRRLWTAGDDRDLQAMHRRRLGAVAIAEKIGRTAWAVRSRIRTLKRKERSNAKL